MDRSQTRKRQTTEARRALTPISTSNEPPLSSPQIRAYLYIRVSSENSVESNLSLPDQERQLVEYCKRLNIIPVRQYEEAGVSAFREEVVRPQFDRMIADALSGQDSINVILVYHTSRFSRRSDVFATNERKLKAKGISIQSITQSFSDDTAGFLGRRVTALFDEISSLTTSQNVRRTRYQMATEGFWPGGQPQFGFALVPDIRNPSRNRLVVDDAEKEIVRKIFKLAEYGDGSTHPLGVKKIAVYLSQNGYTKRDAAWTTNDVHRILTCPFYLGTYQWNVDPTEMAYITYDRTVIEFKVDAIIAKDNWTHVQEMLTSKDPRKGTAKSLSSPMILSGIARCAYCSGGLTLRTGTSKTGKVYRYYHCSTNERRGSAGCVGVKIAESMLDDAVVSEVASRVLAAEHLYTVLYSLRARYVEEEGVRRGSAPAALKRYAAAQDAVQRLLTIAQSVPDLEKDGTYISNLQSATKEAMKSKLAYEATQLQNNFPVITQKSVQAFTNRVKELFDKRDARAKIAIQSVVRRVQVDSERIVISGDEGQLLAAFADSEESEEIDIPRVRGFVSGWRRGSPINAQSPLFANARNPPELLA